MALGKDELQEVYRKRAALYDLTANLYYLIGFPEARYRKKAVSALALQPGAAVVEIGCGTGLNFPYLLRALGPTGKLTGVDLSEAMLQKAQARIERNRWENVQLVQKDAAEYDFPANANGVLSTFALTLVPEYETVIAHAAQALAPDGRFVLLDLKMPERLPLWLVKFAVVITRPFGVTLDLAERRPWAAMQKYFSKVTVTELYFGFAYLAVGERGIEGAKSFDAGREPGRETDSYFAPE